jgi:alcohol dehydrogenase class IV
MNGFQFRTPGTIISAVGSVQQIAEDYALRSAKHALLVTDKTLVELGFAARIETALRSKGVGVLIFDEVEPEPSAETVRKAAAAGRERNVDAVIGLGGGSPMDVAKLVALLVASPQPMEEIYGVDRAVGERLPLVLIPTTAGTGSEVTKVAVVTADNGDKAPVLAPQLYSDTVILDVELTMGLPPKVTAATGVDAMVHAIEALTSGVRKNPVSDQLALQAMRLLFANAPTAVAHGDQVEARSAMLTGSMLAGLAFANATVGAVHALAYPLGTQFHVSHGGSNAVMLVPVMRYNLPEAAPLYAEIARSVLADADAQDDQSAAAQLADALEAMIAEVGLEGRLRDLGIEEKNIDDLVDGALRQERLLSYNIKPLTRNDVKAVFEAAL